MNLAKASIIFKFQILQLKQESIDEEKMGGLSAYTCLIILVQSN
jgi:hypothetical protein